MKQLRRTQFLAHKQHMNVAFENLARTSPARAPPASNGAMSAEVGGGREREGYDLTLGDHTRGLADCQRMYDAI